MHHHITIKMNWCSFLAETRSSIHFSTQFKCTIGSSSSLTTTVTRDDTFCRMTTGLVKNGRVYSILIIASTFDALRRLGALASTNDFQAGRIS